MTPPVTPGRGPRSVLVTGAARGIGEATARRFAALGWRVGAFDVDPCGWAGQASAGTGDGRVVTGELDVTDPASWQRALAGFCGEHGTLDVLVNNAGLLYGTPFLDGSFEQDRALVDVNVTGVLNGCRAAYPYLERAGGTVVNLCSAAAIHGQAEMATYSATKHAVRGISEALDIEWGPAGVTVRAVWPLYVSTSMLEGVETGGMRSLGVRLGAEEVAREVARAAGAEPEARGLERVRSLVPRVLGGPVHRPVGAQARRMYVGSQLAPAALTRLVNRRLTR